VVTGVAEFGLFVQFPRFLVDGLLRLDELGEEPWEVDPERGRVEGALSGRSYRLGDLLAVRIVAVDVARRHLDLALAETGRRGPRRRRG
jgi:ribonuclease R